MSKKNKHYGFPYDYSKRKPIHRFPKEDTEMLIYTEGRNFVMLQKTPTHQQRVILNDINFNNMLGMLDKNEFKEIAV